MALDVSTLQKVYGANKAINSSNTIHRFPSCRHEFIYSLASSCNDTLDCTDYVGDVRVFVEGSDQLSDVGDNFFQFARGTSIKNVITGLGNDRIYAGNTVITTGS